MKVNDKLIINGNKCTVIAIDRINYNLFTIVYDKNVDPRLGWEISNMVTDCNLDKIDEKYHGMKGYNYNKYTIYQTISNTKGKRKKLLL